MESLNVIAILVATIVGMALGALWYSPVLFGNAWMKCLGKTPETLGSATIPMIGSVIANLLTAIGISIIFTLVPPNGLGTAMLIGGVLGLLIIFPAFLSDSLFCGWGNQLLLIQSGYRVLTVFLMSIVFVYV